LVFSSKCPFNKLWEEAGKAELQAFDQPQQYYVHQPLQLRSNVARLRSIDLLDNTLNPVVDDINVILGNFEQLVEDMKKSIIKLFRIGISTNCNMLYRQ
jgi:hypothetical protein